VADTVSIGNFTEEKQVFAATNVMNNIVEDDISGILGLGWQSIASSQATPLVQKLWQDGRLPEPVIAFALETYAYDELTKSNLPGGTMTIGGVDTSAYTGDINYISLVAEGYWDIPLQGVTVNGQDIGITASQTVIDTGTTLIGVPSSAAAAIYAQIPSAQSTSLQGQQGYWAIPCTSDINVSLTFGGVSYAIPAESFNAGAVDSRGTTCLGAVFELDAGNSIDWVIGEAFLTSVYNVYRFDPPAVGFAQLGSGGNTGGSSTTQNTSSGSTSGAISVASSSTVVLLAAVITAALQW
jgi:cathepsin D